MPGGLVALLVAIAAAILGGCLWQLTNGRMRAPRAVRVPGSALVSTGQRAHFAPETRPVHPSVAAAGQAEPAASRDRLTSEQIGHVLGDRATLLQFSTAFCAPCRATRRILADVAGLTQGVTHVEIDAESRLDLVRQLNVLRTPTVLILAADGSIVRRASGQPRKPDVIAAVGAAVGLS
ncbi:MAG: thioredoxin family protein [Streptosporangiaceae bacterium]